MEGFKQPKVGNFVPDRVYRPPWKSNARVESWKCTICGTPGIYDRVRHNVYGGCAPVGWLDPLGVLVETVFALWGPGAPDVVKTVLPPIPEGKSIRVDDLPYFTKVAYSGWMVVGHKEFMAPGTLITVNRKAEDTTQVYVDEWRYERHSPRTGNTYVIATFRRANQD